MFLTRAGFARKATARLHCGILDGSQTQIQDLLRGMRPVVGDPG